jgi:LmbE family N-acetylglucosaminyl deacetylase
MEFFAFEGGRVKICRAAVVFAVLILLTGVSGRAQFPPAPGAGPGLAETIEAIDAARVTTRILYITAHPDDESAAVLTYLSRGLHVDVALLSLTRGEGGQNALGPEQAPQLGLIRTQELLAATRGYGVKLYFTGAKDFGFSKTPEETEKVWGDQVLEDMVRVIRTFRPTLVVNNWGDVHGGHGHHQAAGLLTPKAVALAADEKAFREQLQNEGLPAWGTKQNPVTILDLERGVDKPRGYVLPLDDVSPLWGKTWREIGMDAFANHRTQGVAVFFGNPFFRRPISLKKADGTAPDPESFAVSLHAVSGDGEGDNCKATAFFCPVLKSAEQDIAAARMSALAMQWKETTTFLAHAAQQIASLYPGGSHAAHWVANDPLLGELKLAEKRVQRSLNLAAGLSISATADKGALVAGEPCVVTAQKKCRPGIDCEFLSARIDVPSGWTETKAGSTADAEKIQVTPGKNGREDTAWSLQIPEPPPLLSVVQEVRVAGYRYETEVPVVHIEASSTRVDRLPLRLVPAYTLAVEPKQIARLVANHGNPFELLIRVHSYSGKREGVSVGVELPAGWTSGGDAKVSFAGAEDAYTKIAVTPPGALAAGNYRLAVQVKRGAEKFAMSLEPLPSVPTLLWQEPAQCIVHAFDINVPKDLRVGYITAESEPVPDSLRMLGIQVNLLDAPALNFSDLSRYDAIVVGVRAYELRSELPGANQRLLDYVSNGGTLVVQYERDFAWDGKNYAPYPAKIDGGQAAQLLPRITDETASVNFLRPDDALLNKPNKISAKDFDGWVQERGLYFWTDFDATKYTALLSMHDPGEKELNGALVYAKLGNGTYIYTGLAFFRQLPEGVPGAYRLFVNLLSASRSQ